MRESSQPGASRSILAVGLILCFLLLSSVMHPVTLLDAHDHSHHHPASHSTFSCFLSCVAGQVVTETGWIFGPQFVPVAIASVVTPVERDIALSGTSFSRGPPVPSI